MVAHQIKDVKLFIGGVEICLDVNAGSEMEEKAREIDHLRFLRKTLVNSPQFNDPVTYVNNLPISYNEKVNYLEILKHKPYLVPMSFIPKIRIDKRIMINFLMEKRK